MVLEAAVNSSEKSKKEQIDIIININCKGYNDISNECNYCK